MNVRKTIRPIRQLAASYSLTIGLLIVLAACNTRPAATPVFNTAAPTMSIGTLPPTWTPTTTFTPAPTRTPSLTPLPSNTPSAASLCSNFRVVTAPPQFARVPLDSTVLFAWKGVPSSDAPLIIAINEHGGRAGLIANVPISGDGTLPIPVSRLPQVPQIDWRMWLQHPVYGPICLTQGMFLLPITLTF